MKVIVCITSASYFFILKHRQTDYREVFLSLRPPIQQMLLKSIEKFERYSKKNIVVPAQNLLIDSYDISRNETIW